MTTCFYQSPNPLCRLLFSDLWHPNTHSWNVHFIANIFYHQVVHSITEVPIVPDNQSHVRLALSRLAGWPANSRNHYSHPARTIFSSHNNQPEQYFSVLPNRPISSHLATSQPLAAQSSPQSPPQPSLPFACFLAGCLLPVPGRRPLVATPICLGRLLASWSLPAG